jgi:hypothetical protein
MLTHTFSEEEEISTDFGFVGGRFLESMAAALQSGWTNEEPPTGPPAPLRSSDSDLELLYGACLRLLRDEMGDVELGGRDLKQAIRLFNTNVVEQN